MAQGARQDIPAAVESGASGDGDWQDALAAIEVEETPVLALDEMVAGAGGEVVLFNDSGLRRLSLVTERTVVARGTMAKHRTAEGEDVTGFAYLRFDTGVTLYFPPALDLVVTLPPS